MAIFEFHGVKEFHPMEVYLAEYSNVKRTNKKTEEKTGMKKNPVGGKPCWNETDAFTDV